MIDDKYIWEEFKNGEEYALSHMYHQNIDFLFAYGKKITKDEDLILDIIQDLFYELIQSRKNLGKTDNIRLYLMTSLRRKLIRKIKINRKYVENNWIMDVQPNVVFSVEEDFINEEEKSQRLELFKQAMNELNQKQREVLYYKFMCGFDYKQICGLMSITNDSARQLVSRGINSLKKYMTNMTTFIF